jgi:hypothetical protein
MYVSRSLETKGMRCRQLLIKDMQMTVFFCFYWRLIVKPYEEDDECIFFCFSILMEHRWSEIDKGKSKYSEKNLS